MAFQIKRSFKDLRKSRLFLAVPMYGGNCSGMFARSMADLAAICAQHQIQLQIYCLFNESLITRARNYCCDEFVRSNSTHMMFIDSDIGFNPIDVIALMALQTDDTPFDIIGAPYPKKCISWEKIKRAVDKGFADQNPNNLDKFVGDYVFNPKAGTKEIPIGQPVEVMEIGTGFMMIRRKTFKTFSKAYPHLLYRPDHVRTEHFDGSRKIMAYFDCVIDRGYNPQELHDMMQGVASGKVTELDTIKEKCQSFIDREAKSSLRYLSEDYKFCQDAHGAGLRTWLCPWMKLTHAGTFVFGGSLADLAALGANPTADIGELQRIRQAEKNQKQLVGAR